MYRAHSGAHLEVRGVHLECDAELLHLGHVRQALEDADALLQQRLCVEVVGQRDQLHNEFS